MTTSSSEEEDDDDEEEEQEEEQEEDEKDDGAAGYVLLSPFQYVEAIAKLTSKKPRLCFSSKRKADNEPDSDEKAKAAKTS